MASWCWDGLRGKLVSEVRGVPDRPLQGLGQPRHQNHLEVRNTAPTPWSAPQHIRVLRKIHQLHVKTLSEIKKQLKKIPHPWGTWVAQSVERPTLGFGSGHDPRVVGSSPASGSTPA